MDQSLTNLNKAFEDLVSAHLAKGSKYVEFRATSDETNYGKGFIWAGQGYTKQFVFNNKPDRFFSSEIIDIAQGKYLSVDGVKVLDDAELGASVTKSNLREVGRLKGLMVDGSLSVNNYLFFNGTADRLGLGTDQPNAALSIAEDGIEVVVGTNENRGIIGTYASHSLDIITGNTARITVSPNGNIQLGNTNQSPIQVSVHGKLAVNVAIPDPAVDLHVAGAVRLNNTLQLKGTGAPQSGSYNQGDIVWNSKPQQRGFVGWICVQSGAPGIWSTFGEIK